MPTSKSRYDYQLNLFRTALIESISIHKTDHKKIPGITLYEKNARTPLFQLQGLARIDSKISRHKDLGAEWLDQFKKIEDALGKYDYWVAMIQNNVKWKFPAEINAYFEQQANYNLGVLEHLLAEFGWMTKEVNDYTYSESALNKFDKSSKNAKWYKSNKERIKLLKFFRDELLEINEKIETKELDLNELELGIHELRRKLRWIGIYSSALNGKIALGKPSKNDALSQYVTKENIAVKFNQLPINANEKEIVYFLPGGFYAMSELIKNIGDIKDQGICTHEMSLIGKMFGMTSAKIRTHLGSDYLSHASVVKLCNDLVNQYIVKDKILLHIADYFDKQVK